MTKWVLGHKITSQTVTGDFDLVLGETPSGVQGPPPHFHNIYHEVFLVTEGVMEFMLNGEVSVIRKGQSINVPPQTLHTFSNNSDESSKWINIHSPKGFAEFFDNLGVSDVEEKAEIKSLSPKIIQEVIKTASLYDMIITN